jgi:serine/threonine-protein kinase
MEYVDGPSLYDRIVKEKRLSEKDAIDIVRQVALALQHAHERGFVHRDIKPKNIMMTTQGVVKLADLGLARAVSDKEAAQAEAGRAYGTPYYISPEQVRGEVTIGPQADIYGLGATFYHMVTGKVPFEGKNPSEVMHRHLKSELVPPDHVNPQLSAGAAQVIEMMMAKNVKDRYQNCDDLLEDLQRITQAEPPLFAHKALDMSSVAAGLVAHSQPVEIRRHTPEGKPTESPSFMVTLIVLIASLIANAIFILVMLTR